MKKLVALFLAAMMMLSCMSFASADDVVEITFWHHAGSGGIYNAISAAVADFNAGPGAEKGIHVTEQYIGDYNDLFAKLQLSVQSKEAPDITVLGNTFIGYGLGEGFLVDMAPLAAADGWDVSNILDCFMEVAGNTDGQLHSLPYGRSTPTFFYNKDLVAAAGLNWEDEGYMVTMEDLKVLGEYMKQVDANGNQIAWAYEMPNDFGYQAGAHIYQLGSMYMSPNGEGAPVSQEDGKLLQVLADWRANVDAGYCRIYDDSATREGLFLSGKLAAYTNSCSGLGNMSKKCVEAGINLGIAYFPTYDVNNHVTMIGGCNVAMVKDGTETDETVKASWEFMKFLMEDEQVARVHTETGYFPVTKSAASYQPVVDLWASDARWQVAYDQAMLFGKCQETPYNEYLQDYTQICWDNVSRLIQEGSIDAQTAVNNIIEESADLW